MSRASKSPSVVPISVVPELGLDFSAPATGIADNALRVSTNGYYPPQSKKWRSRPGVACTLLEANKLPGAVDVIRPHFNGTTTYLVAVSNGSIYQITKALLEGSAAGRVFTKIGDLSGVTKPGLLSYNTTLFIADRGAATLRYWTAAGAYGLVTGGPTYPSCVLQAKNRLWANSTNDADSVWGSKEAWTSTTFTDSGYVQLRAGYGDGMNVVDLCTGPGGADIMVFKRNTDGGGAQTRRLNVSDATPANWYVTDSIFPSGSQDNAYASVQAFNDTLFVSDDGIFNMSGVQQYGDIQIGSVGNKINPLMTISGNISVQELSHNEILGCVFMVLQGTSSVYVFTPWNLAFTQWNFGGEVVTSTCTMHGKTYFGTSAGRIYCLNSDNSTAVSMGSDELKYGVNTNFISQFRTKSFAFGGYEASVRKTALLLTPLKSGPGDVSSVDDAGNSVSIFNWNQADTSLLIGGTWAGATPIGSTDAGLVKIGQSSGAPEHRRGFGGPRAETLSFQVTFSGGARAEVSYLQAEVRANLGA